jgi:hypothetical protein
MFVHSIHDNIDYPLPPFSPDKKYVELNGMIQDFDPGNQVYGLMRDLLQQMQLDSEHYGTQAWNPFGSIISKHRKIVIKPNLVLHKVKELSCTIKGLVVHASVLRVIIDYLLLAATRANRDIEISIVDAPLQSADFDRICQQNGLVALAAYYKEKQSPVFLYDLRYEKLVINDHFLVMDRIQLPGDPAGSRLVDLGTLSEHYQPDGSNIRLSIQDYDDKKTNEYHSGKTHQYKFSQTVLDSTLVINVCKLKAHAKAGVTLSLKNVVGANVSKDFLPHFRPGSPREGGDEFSTSSMYKNLVRNVRNFFYNHPWRFLTPIHRLMRLSVLYFESRRREKGYPTDYGGAWSGNDTLWRTIVDIDRILLFSDASGIIHREPQRQMLCFVDGIYGMHGDGPIKGHDIYAGLLACGDDPVEFDAMLAYLMGFDPEIVKHISFWKKADDYVAGQFPSKVIFEHNAELNLHFDEPSGWKGCLRR